MKNPGLFFNADDFEEDDEKNQDADGWKPVRIYGKELFRKSIDVLNITQSISDLLSETANASTGRLMMENASAIPSKIKGAMAVDGIYSVVMEAAVIIKVNICQLKDQLWICSKIHGVEKKYIAILEEEIGLFKALFIKWVNSFDKSQDYPDDWHLFNNPADFPDVESDEDED